MMAVEIVNPLLIRKYNHPVPRYTSYPTVPYWRDNIDVTEWKEVFSKRFAEQNHLNGISLYMHLPFCESLCTYCGCDKKITKNHSVEEEYLEAIQKEWKIYRSLMKQMPVVREIHLGGGTPTFFSPKNLQRLIEFISKGSIIHPQREFSIEGHPNNTTAEHLKLLHKLGFRRISYGVQDNDPEVQRIINRIQPLENVRCATEMAKKAGFSSVNFDLIYGLPKQNIQSIERTFREVVALRPDRIAFYSYAHVPWTSKAQRLFDENDLPPAEEKLQMYLEGKEILMEHGYTDIGMDHFALPHDELYKAWEEERLHRNFMGYTTQSTGLLLGLGVSSISDAGVAFAQNRKTIREYYDDINAGHLSVKKGYFLSNEDAAFRKYISDVACKGRTEFHPGDLDLLRSYSFPVLEGLGEDGLVFWNEKGVVLTDQGHYFLRNICSAFDLHLQRSSPGVNQFSKAI